MLQMVFPIDIVHPRNNTALVESNLKLSFIFRRKSCNETNKLLFQDV